MPNIHFETLSENPAPDTLAVRVYTALREEILYGQLPPGSRLVRRTLAGRLGVSPVPVAEALVRLERDGLVESRPTAGARVRLLTEQQAREDHVMREAIECQAARLCAQAADDATLARLKREAHELDRVLSRTDDITRMGMRMHLDFHIHVAESTGYESLATELRRTWFRRIMRLHTEMISHRRLPDDWHARLVQALESRDPDIAERAMRGHVQGPAPETISPA